MMQDELTALYKRIVDELETNIKYLQNIKGSNNTWDIRKMNEITTENLVLLRERNDLGEILWHSGIDTRKLSVANGEKKQ
jgi:hypothetical protein